MGGRQQQGAALLMVMVVLAMLAAGMAWLVEDGRRQVDDVRLLHQRVQVRAMEQAGLAYAGQALRDPAWRLSPVFWQALRGQPLNYDFGAGQAQLRVRDQHTCFNVNALLGADGERAERQLRYLLGNDMAAERLVDALADWLDADSDARLQGAESAQYLRQQPPRLAADQPMLDTSELNLLLEPDASRQARYPMLCALSQTTGWRLNANALGLEHLPLLEALYEGRYSRSLLSRIISGRPASGYVDAAALRQALGAVDDETFERLSEGLLLNSGHFLLQLSFEEEGRVMRSEFQVEALGVVQWHARVPAQQVRVRSREPIAW
ncbi:MULTISPECIES: type II secretion system minor pseudopilin GspK [Pseudomonas]|jgi:general secretion pathway protein K|uniref:type II secretion system minor pseudopilin GspK n=1 Tax=Pseudomonas TaxID=286 RepID=UPI000CD40D68|nr:MULTISPECIES: type II secretion system minor pseudopilin GspK [Pseudomonas]MCG3642401.1 type II secretion system minor pseudopilin GspK [Pseudomonas putida]MDD2016526.1 type II secretion system minor pseudopilin GspK [Pseudomonas putida]MDH1928744.1 type II secretion system minor pseudopilin GspK [Pseudomonas sp. GD03696]POG00744.1 general secretion pathway protein GspK [Pseudomonas putida]TFW26750.1 general secretion pathway protein GspK [Pseudomonas putida]